MRRHVASFFSSSLGIPLPILLDSSHHVHSFLILDKIDSGFSTSGLISCKNMSELKHSLLGTRLRPQQAAHQDADCSGRQDLGYPAAGPPRPSLGVQPPSPVPGLCPGAQPFRDPPLLQSFLPLSRSFSTAFQGVQASPS